MENKSCTQCNIEKHINNFYKKSSECKDCNNKQGVKRYFDNEERISFQQKIYYEKMEINYYRNKMTTEKKETETLKNYIDPMLKFKIN